MSSYYSEEKTLALPASGADSDGKKMSGLGAFASGLGKPMGGMSGKKLYGRELKQYDDKDIGIIMIIIIVFGGNEIMIFRLDVLLSNLSVDELDELNNDFDPDVSTFLGIFTGLKCVDET
jgi:hypothetical protein